MALKKPPSSKMSGNLAFVTIMERQMKKVIAAIFLASTQIMAFGQGKLWKDLDNDGIKDSVYIEIEDSTIVYRLSTQNFAKIASKPIKTMNTQSGVSGTKNGFQFFNDGMRSGFKNQFKYNSKTRKIQLIGMSRYEFGNASNDGSGESSVNLITGNYIGNWNYLDWESDKLIKIPTIQTKMYFKTINLEEFGEDVYFDYGEKCAELYQKHKNLEIKKRNR